MQKARWVFAFAVPRWICTHFTALMLHAVTKGWAVLAYSNHIDDSGLWERKWRGCRVSEHMYSISPAPVMGTRSFFCFECLKDWEHIKQCFFCRSPGGDSQDLQGNKAVRQLCFGTTSCALKMAGKKFSRRLLNRCPEKGSKHSSQNLKSDSGPWLKGSQQRGTWWWIRSCSISTSSHKDTVNSRR